MQDQYKYILKLQEEMLVLSEHVIDLYGLVYELQQIALKQGINIKELKYKPK